MKNLKGMLVVGGLLAVLGSGCVELASSRNGNGRDPNSECREDSNFPLVLAKEAGIAKPIVVNTLSHGFSIDYAIEGSDLFGNNIRCIVSCDYGDYSDCKTYTKPNGGN